MQIRALVVEERGGPFVMQQVELDEPRADELLVRVVATGVCHTDLTLRDSLPAEMFPRVLGHEGAGVVEAVGADVDGLSVGDHVILSHRSCRSCGPCREGRVGYCESSLLLNYMGFRLDGSTTHHRGDEGVQGSFFGQSSLASHALAYADNCVVVDRSLDLRMVAPYGCGFQTGAGTVLHMLRPRPEQSLVVFGAGSVGIAALMAARSLGCRTLVAVDPIASRRALAEQLGATTVDPAADPDGVVDRVRELSGGGADFAIDTTARSPVVLQAQRALAPKGTLVALGLGDEQYAVDAIDLLQNGKTITSCVEGDVDPLTFIPRLLEMRAAGSFDTDPLIGVYPAEKIDEAVADAAIGAVVKPVLEW